ncbi:MAG: hypothetical protein M0R46_09205 [Candidatus Muirbacterium halophilum]|nr:hypothetical protein [Candidatus Muirbacterium halophilum]MCK9476084.1 hypothetical protein [Candidatus Muirbacterium halophilum]
MKKFLFILGFILSFLAYSIVISAEEINLEKKVLKILKVKSHKSFEIDTIGNCYLAGVSGPKFSDEIFAKAMIEVNKFIDDNKNTDGTNNLLIEKDVSVNKNGKTRTSFYVIIQGKNGMSLNEYLVSRGICYTNKHTEKYFDKEKTKKLEDNAKQAKLYKWSDK